MFLILLFLIFSIEAFNIFINIFNCLNELEIILNFKIKNKKNYIVIENSFNIFNSLNLRIRFKFIEVFYKIFKIDINLDF